MQRPTIASSDEWLAARKELLAKREGADAPARRAARERRRAADGCAIEKEYVFEGAEGARSLADLFEGGASCSSTTSCSTRAGTRAARAARSWPTTSTAARAPGRTRRRVRGDLARAARQDRALQAAHGLDGSRGCRRRQRLQPRLPRHAPTQSAHRVQLRAPSPAQLRREVCPPERERDRGIACSLRDGERRLPHLLDLRSVASIRSCDTYNFARSHAARPSTRRGLVAPSDGFATKETR